MINVKVDMSKTGHKNILTDLDTLFDTRLSLAYILDKENILNEIHNKTDNYRNRILDNFGNISNDIFMQIYRKRSKFLLNNALPTNILDYLKEQVVDYNFDPTNYVRGSESSTIYINFYPYNLTEEEQYELINKLDKYFGGVEIKLLYKKFLDISPEYLIKNKINMVILYELTKWLELIMSEYDLLKNPITHIYLIGPYYFNPRKPFNKIDQTELGKFTEHLNFIAMTNFTPLKEFSAIDI